VRVLLVSPYPPERDGIGAYSAMVGEELREQGHAVAAVSARDARPRRREVIGSLAAAADTTLMAARGFAPDVVHVQFAVAAYGARIPALLRLIDGIRQLGIPVTITMHEVTRDTAALRGPGRALYRRVATRADRIVVHTESARTVLDRLIRARPGLQIDVVPHPRAELPATAIEAEDLRVQHGLGSDRVLLAFGFIDVSKGLGDLIAAAGALDSEGKLDGVKLVVAGDVRRRFAAFRVFELRDRIHLLSVQRKVSRLGLQRRVLFMGFVPAGEIRAWFDLASAAVLPYRRSEQSGVASLAAAAGTPLITTDVGELGRLSCVPAPPPGDPSALANRLKAFLSKGEQRRHRSPGGDLAEVVAETAALYSSLVQDPPYTAVAR
jgi:glycosyltransferase involved in cell wall biosynthesis